MTKLEICNLSLDRLAIEPIKEDDFTTLGFTLANIALNLPFSCNEAFHLPLLQSI
jgi:hypothetical protein